MLLRWTVGAQVWFNEQRERLFEERGATAVEYALMLALIAAVIVGAVAYLGTRTTEGFETVDFPP
ncbi:MAG: Flp family type IVb pilin [Actinomycetota bacterium]